MNEPQYLICDYCGARIPNPRRIDADYDPECLICGRAVSLSRSPNPYRNPAAEFINSVFRDGQTGRGRQ